MPEIQIDGKTIKVDSGINILQACELIGIEIPRFCYHEKLSIAGNCRMCLVEMEGSSKPVASCAMPVADGMKIKTKSEFVKKARNGVMEFLLINHPLDCPVCDQGGECDLQDQAMAYGNGISRYFEKKRAVKDKYIGPLIKTHMTRCIHCTRCVRFGEEIGGIEQLGATGRGEDTEITTFLEKSISSELSGNVIDLCPVGALTSKPYSYIARPWELKKIDSIDVMDAVGSNIRIDTKADKIMRILPRINESINEEWISDKTRFAYDGLSSQRIDKPFIKKNGRFDELSYSELFLTLKEKFSNVKKSKFFALIGNTVDCETIFSFKHFLIKNGLFNFDCRQDNSFFIPKDRSSYVFNSTISGVDETDLCLLIGCDPKVEAPILNARIRKRFLNYENLYPIGKIGLTSKLTYESIHISDDSSGIEMLLNNKHKFSSYIEKAKKPLFIIGQGALCNKNAEKIFYKSRELYDSLDIEESWNGFNILQTFSGRTGALDLEFYSNENVNKNTDFLENIYNGSTNLLYLFAADEIDFAKIPPSTFVIYQGHHGDAGANRADLIIPTTCFTEKQGIYVNIEGRPQISAQIKSPITNVMHSWDFFVELSKYLDTKLDYKNLSELRELMFSKYPVVKNINKIKKNKLQKTKYFRTLNASEILKSNISNFYMTDVVSKNSKTMAECSKMFITKV